MALAILEDLEEEDVPQSSASTMPDLLSKWQPADAQQESLSSEEMVQQYILQNLPPGRAVLRGNEDLRSLQPVRTEIRV